MGICFAPRSHTARLAGQARAALRRWLLTRTRVRAWRAQGLTPAGSHSGLEVDRAPAAVARCHPTLTRFSLCTCRVSHRTRLLPPLRTLAEKLLKQLNDAIASEKLPLVSVLATRFLFFFFSLHASMAHAAFSSARCIPRPLLTISHLFALPRAIPAGSTRNMRSSKKRSRWVIRRVAKVGKNRAKIALFFAQAHPLPWIRFSTLQL